MVYKGVLYLNFFQAVRDEFAIDIDTHIEEGNQRLPGVDDVIFIQKAAWGETCSYWLLGACCALLAAVARSSRHPVQKASH